ncbi:MAG: hypothetical protein EBU46_12530 [Nitrosomonadaceae bacterium]|nr:hypothetical protein [Nitrosomonadaceae bacterium]
MLISSYVQKNLLPFLDSEKHFFPGSGNDISKSRQSRNFCFNSINGEIYGGHEKVIYEMRAFKIC